MQMYVYLIHFKSKLHHAGHYIGFSECLDFRIACHREGTGAKLIRAINRLGIPWIVVRTWKVDGQGFERWLKNQKHASRFCPICNPNLTHLENAYQGGDDFREAFAIELNHMTERIVFNEHALSNQYAGWNMYHGSHMLHHCLRRYDTTWQWILFTLAERQGSDAGIYVRRP